MQQGLGRFRVDTSIPPVTAPPSNYPAGRYTQFHSNPEVAPRQYGDYNYDVTSGNYNKTWSSMDDVESFLAQVQQDECVEFRKIHTLNGIGGKYLQRITFVCARRGTGGDVKYVKKKDWTRKVESKVTNCGALLIVKTYPGTDSILGRYDGEHNHPTGPPNLCFTRVPLAVRDEIAGMLRNNIKPEKVLEKYQLAARSEQRAPRREDFLTLSDVLRILKAIQAESTRFDSNDTKSVLHWVERLRKEDSLLVFKSKTCPIPPGSRVDSDVFILAIQTPWQRTMYRQHGSRILCVDGTHNTTMYENLILTTLLVRDEWSHGIPVAWMLASSGTEDTHGYFLSLVNIANPDTSPAWIMTDRDLAQINACEKHLPLATILLCWWHVLHAWQQHFVISQNEDLWLLLKAWIRITDAGEFKKTWEEIRRIAPPDFLSYLEVHWMPDRFLRMWSAMYRKDRHIFELSDTNMLVEAWHHVLKGKFLEGKRNRRLDHLLYILITAVLLHYDFKQRRQDAGFEGPNLADRKRADVIMKSRAISSDDIEVIDEEDERFAVKSQTDSTRSYIVDLPSYTCECPDYPLIQFCKHLSAVHTHFPATFKHSAQFPPTIHGQNLESNVRDHVEPTAATSCDDEPLAPPISNSVQFEGEILCVLERLMARIRLSPNYVPDPVFLASASQELDRLQKTTDLLPAKVAIAPNQHSWSETRAVMLPARKTTKKRAGDEAYGGGEQSGKKAKRKTKEVTKASRPPATAPVLATPTSVQAHPHAAAQPIVHQAAYPPSHQSQPVIAAPLPWLYQGSQAVPLSLVQGQPVATTYAPSSSAPWAYYRPQAYYH